MIPTSLKRNAFWAIVLLTRCSSAQEASAAASAKPTECNYDDSLSDYLACNKAKYTTTQLLGAGIGVTILIFALAFGTLHLFRRRKRGEPKGKQGKHARDEENARRPGEKSDDEDDDDDEEEVLTDDDGATHRAKNQPDRRESTQRDEKRHQYDKEDPRPPRYSKAARVEDADNSDEELPVSRDTDKKLPLTPELRVDDTMLRPSSRHAPSSTRSSRIGSPTESRSVRNLYPSNPDPQASKRDTLKPPSKPSRPPSTVWQPPRDPDGLPSAPPRTSSSRPANPSRLRPDEDSPPPAQPRPTPRDISARPKSRANPPKRPPTVGRSSSMYSTDSARTDYSDMPLPTPPAPSRTVSRSSNTYLPKRSSSRASMASSRQSTLASVSEVPDVPEVPRAVGAAPVQNPVRASRHPTEMRAASVSASVHEADKRESREGWSSSASRESRRD